MCLIRDSIYYKDTPRSPFDASLSILDLRQRTFRPMLPAADAIHNHPVRVLIVEDDEVEKTHLSILLEELGYEIVGVADNALDALVAFAKTQPDLVMLDIHLKGEASGVDVAHKLREISDVPVLFLTSFATREMFEEARRTSPNAYLTKPIDPLTLESHVELALQQHAASASAQKPLHLPKPPSDFFFTRIGKTPQKGGHRRHPIHRS